MSLSAQHDNKVISSFLLYLDHLVCGTGQAYTNTNSPFYRISGYISPYTVYSAPYRPFVADSSVPGATVMSGLYLNNTFITTGQSGFVDIDYNRGLVYFANPITGNLSGYYAVKDFNISLTNKPEQNLLIETKHYLKPRVGATITGLKFDDNTYPAIYIKNQGGFSDEFAIGGMEKQTQKVRVIVMADSLYSSDAVCSLVKDRVRSIIGLLTPSEQPFNSLGGFKSGNYNYNNLVGAKIGAVNTFYIDRVNTSVFFQESFQSLTNLNSEVYVSFVDVELCSYRRVRL